MQLKEIVKFTATLQDFKCEVSQSQKGIKDKCG